MSASSPEETTAGRGSPPGPRLIDPRGHRFGAGFSVAVLAVAFLASAPLLVVAIWLALGTSALFGTRYSALGRPWPLVRAALRLAPPAALESEYPPRFAQALGAAVLSLALILFVAGAPLLGWLAVAAVSVLQTVLAATGYCLGCRLYFLRWWVPAAFDRLARLTTFAG